VTALLALTSALLVGGSDFLGGVASRSAPAVRVAALAQLVSFLLSLPVAAAVGTDRVTGADVLWSVASGLAVAAGLGLFYTAMSRGLISLVAPTAAITGASVPVAFALARFVVPIGALEMAATVTLLLALQRGPLAVASVLASLYPVTTVLLAAGILRERLSRLQLSGVAIAMLAAVLVSTA
jgi:uncharacterized membrane protein